MDRQRYLNVIWQHHTHLFLRPAHLWPDFKFFIFQFSISIHLCLSLFSEQHWVLIQFEMVDRLYCDHRDLSVDLDICPKRRHVRNYHGCNLFIYSGVKTGLTHKSAWHFWITSCSAYVLLLLCPVEHSTRDDFSIYGNFVYKFERERAKWNQRTSQIDIL